MCNLLIFTLSNLGHFTLFIIRVYLKVWYTSTDASGALLNVLIFLKIWISMENQVMGSIN